MSGTESTPTAETQDFPARMKYGVYGAAGFANSLGNMSMVVLPLWAVMIDSSPLMIGIMLGSRHILVLFYSIHGGALMDRLEPRKVMISFAVAGTILPLLFPIFPYVLPLIVLQMISGYAGAMGWIGAQSVVATAMKGSTLHAGRMSAASRFAAFIGPPIAGAAWDIYGPWGGFAVLAFWGFGILVSAFVMPTLATEEKPREKFTPDVMIPRLSDYVAAFSLLAIPVIAAVMMTSVFRVAGQGIMSSFYVVFLEQAGYTGTIIGTLLSIHGLAGGIVTFFAGRIARQAPMLWLCFILIAISVVGVAITPLLGNYWLLLFFAALNGACYGLSQPLLITLTSRGTGPEHQSKAVGLRVTSNRLAAAFLPITMGAIVEAFGLEESFYITGGIVLALLGFSAIYALLTGATRQAKA